MSAGHDELHRALKIGGWDRRILRRYFLIRPVIDTVAGELLPVAHRVAAESAIAVIDQQRPGTGNRRFYCISRRIPGCFWHDFNHNWPHSRALTCTILSELYDPGKQTRKLLSDRLISGPAGRAKDMTNALHSDGTMSFRL